MMSTMRAEWLKLKAEWDACPVEPSRPKLDEDEEEIEFVEAA